MLGGGSAMLTVDELLHNVAAYQNRSMSFEEFENWFEDNSIDSSDANELRAAIDAVFAEYHYDYIGEDAFRKELAAAIRPFASPAAVLTSALVFGKSSGASTRSTTRLLPLMGPKMPWLLQVLEQSKMAYALPPAHQQKRTDNRFQIA
jgi:hypothetical protein